VGSSFCRSTNCDQ